MTVVREKCLANIFSLMLLFLLRSVQPNETNACDVKATYLSKKLWRILRVCEKRCWSRVVCEPHLVHTTEVRTRNTFLKLLTIAHNT